MSTRAGIYNFVINNHFFFFQQVLPGKKNNKNRTILSSKRNTFLYTPTYNIVTVYYRLIILIN